MTNRREGYFKKVSCSRLKGFSYICTRKEKRNMDKLLQNRVTYMIYCINAFAERYRLSAKQAFAYLQRFKGLTFLDECYEAEHQLSLSDAVDDLSIICKRNGGALG